MSSIVIRPKPENRHNGQLAEKMIDWPDGAVSAYRDLPGRPWKFRYMSDVLEAKREKMERALAAKRSPGPHRRALYVWVFWCPGPFFMGWWTYLVGIGGKRYHGGGVKGDVAADLLDRVMSLFPVANPYPLFRKVKQNDWRARSEWAAKFARQHQRGRRGGRPQGKAAVWATVEGSSVLHILGPAARNGLTQENG